MNYRIVRTDELTHHGILGQKWGKRNGPPYPLGDSDRSPKERAMNSKSKSSNKEDDGEKHKGLTDSQKKAIKIGAAVTATALVAAGGVYLYKTGALQKIGRKTVVGVLNGDVGKGTVRFNTLNNAKTVFKNTIVKNDADKYSVFKNISNPDFNPHHIARDVVKPENFNSKNPLYTSNCKENALTFFLRRNCGKDVQAPARQQFDDLRQFVGNYFKGESESNVTLLRTGTPAASKYIGKTNKETATNYIKSQMLKGKYKEGDCGAFGISQTININGHNISNGHTIAFYIENGEPKFQNIFQTSGSHNASDWFETYTGNFEFQVVNFSRLEPIIDKIQELYK